MLISVRKSENHATDFMGGTAVNRVNSFKFLGGDISDHLPVAKHIAVIIKKDYQCYYVFRRLRRFRIFFKLL